MKEKILRGAASIISKRGIKAASIRAICTQVGVTAPTLYHYFNDRQGLLEAVTLMAFEKTTKQSSKVLDSGDPIEDLKAIWDEYIHFANSEPELYAIMIASVTQGQIPNCGLECFKRTIEKFEMADEKKLLKMGALESAFIYQAAGQGAASLILSKVETSIEVSHKLREIVLAGLLK